MAEPQVREPESRVAGVAATLDAPPESLFARLTALGIREADLVPRHDGTLLGDLPPTIADPRPDMTTAPPPEGEASPGRTFDPTRVVLGDKIGEGGMGLVHVADQPALRREVAVKTLRPERKTPAAVSALLREAWVTGRLEHPNVVPIHLVYDHEDPRVVMKRVEGMTWDTLLDAPDLVGELLNRPLDSKERLRFHLRVFTEVCHAVHFAHARGILHLDLKPENVMVGRFGEVYLLDWGIAAAIPGLGPEWLPPADQIRGVRGTPAWMPPEMAAADGASIGVASDVYLLGGLLHALLVNTPRHGGSTVRETLEHAYRSAPYPYPPLPPELADLAGLANRATARLPERRPPSAEAMRRAIEDHLEHQSSIELAADGERRLEQLSAAYAQKDGAREPASSPTAARPAAGPRRSGPERASDTASSPTAARPADAFARLAREFLECRFSFQQALKIWPENTRARDGLQRLLRASALHALEHQQLERATECIGELSPRDPELERRLTALGKKLYGQRERLRVLERDADANAYHRQRSYMSIGAGLLFVAWNATFGALHRASPLTLSELVWTNLTTIVIFFGAAVLVRRSLLTTATNRRLVILFGSGFAAILVLWAAALVHSQANPDRALRVEEVLGLSQSVFVYFVLAVTFTMDGRVAWLLPGVIALGVVSPLWPAYGFELLGASGALIGFFLAALWWRPRPPRGPDPA